MDATLKKITDFSTGLAFESIPAEVIHQCKRRVIDSLGCALGGFKAEPSKIARALAHDTLSRTPARVIGTLEPSSPEMAAFANGVMIRYLDLNDATGIGGGHPSDMFGALLSVSDAVGASGRALIRAVVTAYELYMGFFSGRQVRDRGFDHVVYTATGAAAGVSQLMRLEHRETAQAIALALAPNMALGVTRRGQLSMWKGCAGGNAARNAVFAARLAAQGLTGPQSVFEGDHGVLNAVGAFDWPPLGDPACRFRILDTQLKMYPCIYPGQSPVTATLAVQPRSAVDQVEAIVVRTYLNAWWESASEPEMWSPATRETADHSIPYLVAAALMDGRIAAASFSDERRADPRLRELIRKVEVIHDKALDALTPANDPCRLEIRLKSGEKLTSSIDFPKGHVKNPASDREVEEKFASMNDGLLSPAQVSRLLELCWKLEDVEDLRELISLTRI